MKLLDGQELVEFIQERQAKQVRALRQAHAVVPKLVIIQTTNTPKLDYLTDLYKTYALEIFIDTEFQNINQTQIQTELSKQNENQAVHGVIVQLATPDKRDSREIFNKIDPRKDVTGMAQNTSFDAPAPIAIDWLLAGYNIDLRGKNLVIVGNDIDVAQPLAKRWQNSGLEVQEVSNTDLNLTDQTRNADVLISSSGVPGLIKSNMVKPDTVIVDAGFTLKDSQIVGDVSKEVYDLSNIKINPAGDDLWQLVVCAIFDNVIRSAQKSSQREI